MIGWMNVKKKNYEDICAYLHMDIQTVLRPEPQVKQHKNFVFFFNNNFVPYIIDYRDINKWAILWRGKENCEILFATHTSSLKV